MDRFIATKTTTLNVTVLSPAAMTLQTPVALVTGCNSGIGRQIAIALASKDMTVLATARSVDSLKELAEQYPNIRPLPLSLDSNDSISALSGMVMDLTDGRLDILVNNAGTHYAATALDMDVEEAVKLFQINVFAVMRLCKMFVPMLQKSPHGKIVQIGSVTRNVPVVWQSVYNASKAALSQYSKTLRLVSDLANGRHYRILTKYLISKELQLLGIRVIEVVTGFVRSSILRHGLVAPEDSLYLPIKTTIERFKYEGNANGMPAEQYAISVVNQVMQSQPPAEIWEGALVWYLRFIVNVCPLWLQVRWPSLILSILSPFADSTLRTGSITAGIICVCFGNETVNLGPGLQYQSHRRASSHKASVRLPWHHTSPLSEDKRRRT